MKKLLNMAGVALSLIFIIVFSCSVQAKQAEAAENLEKIQKSIAAKTLNWQAGETSMTKLLSEQRRAMLGSLSLKNTPQEILEEAKEGERRPSKSSIYPPSLPAMLDWRNHNGENWMTPINDQGPCGSCWAFATLAGVESRMKIKAGNPALGFDYSEQYLMSCSDAGNCADGGYAHEALEWMKSTGVPDEACFPYQAIDVPCNPCLDIDQRLTKIVDWYWVGGDPSSQDVNAIKTELMNGPVSTYMVVYEDFYSYRGGIYEYSVGIEEGGHSVTLVGWDDTSSPPCWIAKNSWGSGWGENGYFRIRMGVNEAAIEEETLCATVCAVISAHILVSPVSGVVTTEAEGAGHIATFTVVLDIQPTADVAINLSSSDITEGTVSPASITFTPSNWNVAQTVTITGVDDTIDDGDVAYTIITAAAVSTDAGYNGVNPDDVSVINIDDDIVGIIVNPTSGLITTEAGGTAYFTVVLATQPTADVIITLSSSKTAEGTVLPASITFTPATWNIAQTVTITGVDDSLDDGDVGYTVITAAAISADSAYNGLDPADVSVTNLERPSANQQVIHLSQGWNLISFQINRCFYDTAAIPSARVPGGVEYQQVSSMADWASSAITGSWQRMISLDQNGAHIFDKDLPPFINTLHYVSLGYGYWIKMNEPGAMTIDGQFAAVNTPLVLNEGWNLLGFIAHDKCYGNIQKSAVYPYQSGYYQEQEGIEYSQITSGSFLDTALSSIAGKFLRVIGFDPGNGGMIYDSQLPPFVNTLHYLGPKYGYWIKMSEEGILVSE